MTDRPSETYFHNLHQLLVAFDHSSFALHAFHFAMALAERAEAEVTAVHVVPEMHAYFREVLYPYAALGADAPSIEAELLEHARAALLEATRPVREQFADTEQGDEIYARIFYGDVVQQIRDSITATSADIVLCGAFGQRPPTPGRLGGVAGALVGSALRPSLVVKSAGGSTRVRRVLVAVDGSRASAGLLNWAVSLALQFEAEDVELITVIPDPSRDDPCGLLGSVRAQDLKGRLQERGRSRAVEVVQRALEDLYVPFPLEQQASDYTLKLHTPVADPVTAIVGAVEEREIDVVVVGTRHPDNSFATRIGRVAGGVARLATCHVLVIPTRLCDADDDRD